MNWAKWQTILMAIVIIGTCIAAYASVQSTLATHTTKLDNIESNQVRQDRAIADITDILLGRRKFSGN